MNLDISNNITNLRNKFKLNRNTMKRIMKFLCTGVLASALCAGLVACDVPVTRDGLTPDPLANCWVFVKTTPGEETILLARGGLTVDEAFAIHDGYEAEYGEDNVMWTVNYPGGINDFELDLFEIDSSAITNCYELTMTIDFTGAEVPPRERLLGYGFRGVRINGTIVVGKKYFWAYTEEGASLCIQWAENSAESYFNRWYGGGTIIDASTIKNLGPEVHDMPMEF